MSSTEARTQLSTTNYKSFTTFLRTSKGCPSMEFPEIILSKLLIEHLRDCVSSTPRGIPFRQSLQVLDLTLLPAA